MIEWARESGCRYILCGHVHECGGNIETMNNVTVVNAATKPMFVEL